MSIPSLFLEWNLSVDVHPSISYSPWLIDLMGERSNSIRVLSGVASSLIKGSGLRVLELKSCMCVHAFLWNDLYQTCR